MHALRELQTAFMSALIDDQIEPAIALLADSVHAPAIQLGVYRNNAAEGFRKALELEFPVLAQLVGCDYFTQLARQYQQACPSRSGDLQAIGAQFSAFLESRFHASEHAYFIDVARLEWACECVALRPREQPATASMLAGAVAGDGADLRLVPRRDLEIVRSHFPVATIWRLHRTATPEALDAIDMLRAEAALVLNGAGGIEVVAVGDPAGAFLEGLRRGESLETAYTTALTLDGEFDLTEALRMLLSIGAFTGIEHVPTNPAHSTETTP